MNSHRIYQSIAQQLAGQIILHNSCNRHAVKKKMEQILYYTVIYMCISKTSDAWVSAQKSTQSSANKKIHNLAGHRDANGSNTRIFWSEKDNRDSDARECGDLLRRPGEPQPREACRHIARLKSADNVIASTS